MTFKFSPIPKHWKNSASSTKHWQCSTTPDRGGSTADMQAINNEYDKLFAILKDKHTATNQQAETTPEQDAEYNEAFKDIISRIIHFEGIEIEIIGSWIWVTGNTYAYKANLKELGFTWCKNKTAWTWHKDEYRKKSKKQYSMDDLRTMFNSEKVTTKKQHFLSAATV